LPAGRGLRRRGPERGVRAHVRAARAHGPEGVPAPRRLAQELYAPARRGARRTAAAPRSAAPVRISTVWPGSWDIARGLLPAPRRRAPRRSDTAPTRGSFRTRTTRTPPPGTPRAAPPGCTGSTATTAP